MPVKNITKSVLEQRKMIGCINSGKKSLGKNGNKKETQPTRQNNEDGKEVESISNLQQKHTELLDSDDEVE